MCFDCRNNHQPHLVNWERNPCRHPYDSHNAACLPPTPCPTQFFPFLVFLTVAINTLFILTKGANSFEAIDDMAIWKRIVISIACGICVGVLTAGLSYVLKNRLDAYFEGRADKPGAKQRAKAERTAFAKIMSYVFRGVDVDVHEVVESNHVVNSIHEH